jgi:hypothetical protein
MISGNFLNQNQSYTWLRDFKSFHAFHLALFTKSTILGLDVLQAPTVAFKKKILILDNLKGLMDLFIKFLSIS